MMTISRSKQIRLEEEEVEKPLLKDQYREDKPVFINLSKEKSSKLFGFEIESSEKDDSGI